MVVLVLLFSFVLMISFYIGVKKIFKFSLVPWASTPKFLLVRLPYNFSEMYRQMSMMSPRF